VPDLDHEPLEDLFRAIRTILGRSPYKEEKDRFGKYLDLLLSWNQTHRITGVRSARDVVHKLFVDSLLFYPLLPPTRPLRLLDVGAGAGIPGIPLRIVDTGIALTLIEAKRKKVSFLEMLKEEIGIKETRVLQGRAEVIINQCPDLFEKFDAVVSRAVSSLEIICPLALPYLRPGGLLIISGRPLSESALLSGAASVNRQDVRISDLGVQRQFWSVRKD